MNQNQGQAKQKKKDLEQMLAFDELNQTDPWELLQNYANAFISSISKKEEPKLRDLPEGQDYSAEEVQGFAMAKKKWQDESDFLESNLKDAENRLKEYMTAIKKLGKVKDTWKK